MSHEPGAGQADFCRARHYPFSIRDMERSGRSWVEMGKLKWVRAAALYTLVGGTQYWNHWRALSACSS